MSGPGDEIPNLGPGAINRIVSFSADLANCYDEVRLQIADTPA